MKTPEFPSSYLAVTNLMMEKIMLPIFFYYYYFGGAMVGGNFCTNLTNEKPEPQ